MRETLIDTDILSEIMEGKDAALAARAKQYYRVFRQYTISAATYAEIRAGLAYNPKPKDVRSFELIEPLLDVLPIEREEAATAGQIIGLMVLATGNFAHYQRIVDLGFPLELENWREP